jgi:hypothetical protein
MTIQSSSPRTRFVSFAGSVPRFVAKVGKPTAVLSLVLGLVGSCSRITRSISNISAFSSSLRLNGGLPARSSYRRTPKE